MSDDNFLTKIEKTWTNYKGDDWTPEKALDNMALYDVPSRVNSLEQLEDELAKADTSDLRSYAKLSRLASDANRLHQALLRSGR